MQQIDAMILQLESAWVESGMPKATLAQKADLHQNTLRLLGKPAFNPSVWTIRALQRTLFPRLPEAQVYYGQRTSRRRAALSTR